MKKKLFVGLGAAVLSVCTVFALAACDEEKEKEENPSSVSSSVSVEDSVASSEVLGETSSIASSVQSSIDASVEGGNESNGDSGESNGDSSVEGGNESNGDSGENNEESSTENSSDKEGDSSAENGGDVENKGPISKQTWESRINNLHNEKLTMVEEDSTIETDGEVFYQYGDGMQTYMMLDETGTKMITYFYDEEETDWQVLIMNDTQNASDMMSYYDMMRFLFQKYVYIVDDGENIMLSQAYHLFDYNEETDSYVGAVNVVMMGDATFANMSIHFAETGMISIGVEMDGEEMYLAYGGGAIQIPNIYEGMGTSGNNQGPITAEQWKNSIEGITTNRITLIGDNSAPTIQIDGNIMYTSDGIYADAKTNMVYAQLDGTWVKMPMEDGNVSEMISTNRQFPQELIDEEFVIYYNGQVIKLKEARDLFTYNSETQAYTAIVYMILPTEAMGITQTPFFRTQVSLKFDESNNARLTWKQLGWTDENGADEPLEIIFGSGTLTLPNAMTWGEYVESMMPPEEL